jgi:DNA-binding MarR family transcriptional regulator
MLFFSIKSRTSNCLELARSHMDKKSEISGFILERSAKRMKQYFQACLSTAETGITIDQWVVLQVLDKQDGLSQLEIAKATFKDPPTITRIIDLLCEKGLTIRAKNSKDRRRFDILLTQEGRDLIAQVLPIIRDARAKAWQGLRDEEMDQLVSTLDTVFENLNGAVGP